MAMTSFDFSSQASCPSTRRLVVAKAETRCSALMQRLAAGFTVVATPGGFSIQGDQVGHRGPPIADPGHKAGREQIWIKAVHERAEPVGAGDAEVELAEAAQEGEMGLAPIGDVLVVVVAGDRAAHD